jgi:polyphosphate kinase 2 (PPK2 family)
VHPEYILNENLPGLEDVSLITDAFGKRMEQIRNFEKHITENGTIVQILSISKEEQRTFIEAFRRKKKQLEVLSGLKERERWDDYMHYYEEAINNTIHIWYVIPADDKEMCRYIKNHLGRNAETH